MIGLLIGVLLLVVVSAIGLIYENQLKQKDKVHGDNTRQLSKQITEAKEQYFAIQVYVEEEIQRLELAVEDMDQEKDPNSQFPAMEISMEHANNKAKLRALQTLYEDMLSTKA